MVLSPFFVHSFTGNYTDTLDDAKTAVGLRPSFLKAFVRGMLAIVPSSKFSVESRVGGGRWGVDPPNISDSSSTKPTSCYETETVTPQWSCIVTDNFHFLAEKQNLVVHVAF